VSSAAEIRLQEDPPSPTTVRATISPPCGPGKARLHRSLLASLRIAPRMTRIACVAAPLDAPRRAQDDNGIVTKHGYYPAAHELAEHGWLTRRFEANGDMSWHWTPAGATAFDITRSSRASRAATTSFGK
jgi:hypothetical protein